MTIIYFIIFLSLLIITHELGHLWVAKRAGIGAPDFAVGFGPTLFSKSWNGTTYHLKLLPLGGFVKISGMDDETAKDSPDNYYNKPWATRFATIMAGPFMNFALAYLILFIIFSFIGLPSAPSNQVLKVFPSSPAETAGLQRNDRIISFNKQQVTNANILEVVKTIHTSKAQTFAMTIERKGKEIGLVLNPIFYPERNLSLSGFSLGSSNYKRVNPLVGLIKAYQQFEENVVQIVAGIAMLVSGNAGIEHFAGPIGIASLAGEAGASGLVYFLLFTAFMSINLGLVNLLPLPALDGGRLLFLFIERIAGKPLNKTVENTIHNLGFALLISLLMYITLHNDLAFLWRKT